MTQDVLIRLQPEASPELLAAIGALTASVGALATQVAAIAALLPEMKALRGIVDREARNNAARQERAPVVDAEEITGVGATATAARPPEAAGVNNLAVAARGQSPDGAVRAAMPQPAGEVAQTMRATAPRSPAPADGPIIDTGDWRTPERRQVLRRDWSAGVQIGDIRAALDELPGATLPNNTTIAQWANNIAGRRPDWFKPALPGRKPADQAPAAPRLPEAVSPAPPRGEWLTEERKTILRRCWPAGMLIWPLREALQAAGGPPLPDNGRIATAATNLKLQRPAGFCGRPVGLTHTPAVAEVPRSGGGSVTIVRNTARPAAPAGLARSAPTPPAPPAVRAIPPALANRDGTLSSPAVEFAREAAAARAGDPVTLDDARRWAGENKVELLPDDDAASVFRKVNATRAKFDLPPWRCVAARGAHDALPNRDVISHFEGSAA